MNVSDTTKMIYEYIVDFALRNDFLPSYANVTKAMNMHRTSIQYHFSKLHSIGKITICGHGVYKVNGLKYNFKNAKGDDTV